MTKVADKTFGKFMKFIHDVVQRVLKGSLDPNAVMKAIRPLIGQPAKLTLDQALAKLESAMRERVGDNHYIDSDTKEWFDQDMVNAEPQQHTDTSVHRFSKDISHRDSQKECRDRGDYYECGLVKGIIHATELIKAGEIDTPGTGVVIYLSNTYNGRQCRLNVWRGSGDGLWLIVAEVGPDDVWSAGNGVLRKNLKNS